MQIVRSTLVSLIAILALASCDQAGQTGKSPAAGEQTASTSIDTTRYISAANLLARMQGGGTHYVFDVRSEVAFEQSHIRDAAHMPYGKTEPADVAALDGMTLDTPIVTYCGCPHTLAGLAADQLIEWGYHEVRVLHEGFWYWRDNQFPLAGLQQQQTSELALAGRVLDGARPIAHTDVFIRNQRNGQLEAAATDADGRFATGFRVYDYRPDDRFTVLVGSLDPGQADLTVNLTHELR